MPIEALQGDAKVGVIKFMGKNGEGHRGLLLGLSPDGKEAFVLALTSSGTKGDDVVWGATYIVVEDDPKCNPVIDEESSFMPDGWSCPFTMLPAAPAVIGA